MGLVLGVDNIGCYDEDRLLLVIQDQRASADESCRWESAAYRKTSTKPVVHSPMGSFGRGVRLSPISTRPGLNFPGLGVMFVLAIDDTAQ